MAQIGLNLYFTGFTGKLIVVWKKSSAPLAEVDRSSAISFPVDQILNVPNLTPETYNFEFWQSTDGIALSTLIRTWSIDASAYSGGIVTQYEYIVDRGNSEGTIGSGDYWIDPASGQAEIVDERYEGVAKEDIQVEMRGTGKRRSDEWDVRTGGGITIVAVDPGSGDPEVFAPQDSIFVTVYQKTSTAPAPTSSASEYSDIKIVNSNQALDTTYKNKIIYCNSSNPVTTITFPAFSGMADQKIKFSTVGMTGNYLSLVFTTSIPFGGVNRDKIHLTTGRVFEIMIKSGAAYILSTISDAGYDVRGNRIMADDAKTHQKLCDATLYDPADYPGIVEWIKSLPSQLVVSTFGSWNTDANKKKFYLNESAGEMAFGDLRDMHQRALKTFDGVNGYPGAYETDAMPLHYHEETIGVLPTIVFGRGTVSRAKGNYDRQQNGVCDTTGAPCNADGSPITTADEVKVKTFRQYAVINL